MTDSNPNQDQGDEKSEPNVSLPPRAPIPAPPIVEYQRPSVSGPKTGERFDPTAGRYQPADREKEDKELVAQGVQGYGIAITAVISLLATILGFVFVGQWIDKRFEPNSTPWGTIVCTLLGMVGGFLNMFRIMLGPGGKKNKRG